LPSSNKPTTPAPRSNPTGGPVPAGFVAWSVTFVYDRQAYVLGDAPCAHAPCTSLVRTLDGGRSWQGVPAPRATLLSETAAGDRTPTTTVREVRFATGQDGYAFGGGLWTTHDGARTWRRVTGVGVVLDLATDRHTVYAVTATCSAGSWSCHDLRLLSSPISADAFGPVSIRVPAADHGAAGTVSTAGGTTVAQLNGATYVRAGSGAWIHTTEPCQSLPDRVEPAASGRTLTAFCAEGAAGSTFLSVQQSTDLGRHWTPVRGQPVQLANEGRSSTSTTAASTRLLAVAWANPLYGGGLSISPDGGRTWTHAPLPKTGAGWRYVGARSATALVALPDPPAAVLWTSNAAERTWTPHSIR
jgi:hypothetical protein